MSITYDTDMNGPGATAELDANRRALRVADALARGDAQSLPALVEHFWHVHRALAEGGLDPASWQALDPRLPSVGWWRAWDRCERLRRAAISLLARHGGCIGGLLRGADARTVQYMVKSCLASAEGSALLQSLIQGEGAPHSR